MRVMDHDRCQMEEKLTGSGQERGLSVSSLDANRVPRPFSAAHQPISAAHQAYQPNKSISAHSPLHLTK